MAGTKVREVAGSSWCESSVVEPCGVGKGGSWPLGVALLRLLLYDMCKGWER